MNTYVPNRLPVADPVQVRRALLRLFAAEKGTIVLVVVLYLAASGAGAAVPVALGVGVDGIATGWSVSRVDLLCAVLFCCVAAQLILVRIGRRAGHRFGDRAAARIREETIDRVLKLPLGMVERAGTGDLSTRTSSDVAAVAGLLRRTGPEVSAAGVELFVLFAAGFFIHPVLGLGLLMVVPPLLLVARQYVRQARPVFLAERAAGSEIAETLTASVAGARTIAAYRMQAERQHAGQQRADQHYTQLRRIIGLQTWFLPSLDLSYIVPTFTVLLGGGLWALRGGVSTGAVVAATMLAYRLAGPLDRIMYSLTEFQTGAAALARIEGINLVKPDKRHARTHGSDIELDRVRFGYGDDPDVLHGLSLRPRPGERLAVVGPSGAGKSTIARLISGFDRPRSGTVTIGGTPTADIELETLREKVILVTQEHYVFTASLRDNLALAAPATADNELEAALESVGASWLVNLPKGLNTMLGTEHYQLNPAQIQQLALARVLLADPDIVILDEATAGLDPGSAGDIEAALTAALHGRTVIAIAHQLQAAVGADRIAVIEQGRVTELGPHSRLLKRGGTYSHLWKAWTGTLTPGL